MFGEKLGKISEEKQVHPLYQQSEQQPQKKTDNKDQLNLIKAQVQNNMMKGEVMELKMGGDKKSWVFALVALPPETFSRLRLGKVTVIQ